jgi:uncharacterized membrane protein YdjX (TVP38/TMEM64 family)
MISPRASELLIRSEGTDGASSRRDQLGVRWVSAAGDAVGTVEVVRRKRMVGTAALAVLILAALVVLGRLGPDGLNAAAVQDAVRGVGAWAPALFVVLQVLVTVPPVPRTIFTVAAGLLFGSVLGVVVAVISTALAAVVAFWLVRLTGGGFMERFADRGPVVWTRKRLDRSGLLAVTSLRLIPALPFSLLNYAAGLSGVRFVPYVLGTILGTAPGTVALVVLGDAVTGRVTPALLAVSVTGGLVGTFGAVVAARRPHMQRAPSPY